jgi:hypothetical protein
MAARLLVLGQPALDRSDRSSTPVEPCMTDLEREHGQRTVNANAQKNMMQSPCWPTAVLSNLSSARLP